MTSGSYSSEARAKAMADGCMGPWKKSMYVGSVSHYMQRQAIDEVKGKEEVTIKECKNKQ